LSGPATAVTPWIPSDLIAGAYEFLAGQFKDTNGLSAIHAGLADLDACRIGTREAGAAELLLDVYEHLYFMLDDQVRLKSICAASCERILDFGAGAGTYALALAASGRTVTCVEPNDLKRKFIAFWAEKYGIARHIDFTLDGSYDAVVCVNVLDHLASPASAIEKFARHLDIGGTLFLYAHFTPDGVHVSDERSIAAVIRALDATFVRGLEQPGPALEIWIRGDRKDSGGSASWHKRPNLLASSKRWARLGVVVHPDLRIIQQAPGQMVACGNRFYLRPARLDSDALTVLQQVPSRRTVGALFESTSLTRTAFLSLISGLWKRRFIGIADLGDAADA
jgi:SAM-dependent methyltransferase